MNPFILATKLGMTQVFHEDGTQVPVTVLKAGPCVVTQVKTATKDGYAAAQIGFGSAKHLNKPETGHQKASDANARYLREVRIDNDESPKLGTKLDVSQFENINMATVIAVSKGKGFAGVIKRHNFKRGPETHGSDHHRKPGSIGSMFPQRTLKGKKLPGHMGAARVTVKNLHIVNIDPKNNLLSVRGAVPGAIGCLVEVHGIK